MIQGWCKKLVLQHPPLIFEKNASTSALFINRCWVQSLFFLGISYQCSGKVTARCQLYPVGEIGS